MRTLTKIAGIAVFLAAVSIPSHAARATALVSVPGPMTGSWKLKIKNVNYKTDLSKPVTETFSINVTFTDVDGDTSPLTMTGVDPEGNPINFAGQRVRQAFFMQSGNDEFLRGTVTGKANVASALSGSGGGTSVDSIDFYTATAKRNKL